MGLLKPIPFGFCHCGCGDKTPLWTRGDSRRGAIKGEPQPYLRNHIRRRNEDDSLGEFKIDGVYCRLISLTRGQFAIVDASDYEHLSRWNWAASPCGASPGYYATRNGSQKVGAHKRRIMMHREVLGLGPDISIQGDHIHTGDTLDNRRNNLRQATQAQNIRNRRKPVTNTSGFKGVTASRGKWCASICVNGKHRTLGRFDTPEKAHTVYASAAEALHQEFASA